MNGWLSDFVYRINFPWITLVTSPFIVLTLDLLPVRYQTMKAARLDLAKTLKYE